MQDQVHPGWLDNWKDSIETEAETTIVLLLAFALLARAQELRGIPP